MQRSLGVIITVVVTTMLLAGCTANASLDAPFAAPAAAVLLRASDDTTSAKSAFLAYVSAGNRVELDDPSTFDDVFALTTDERLEYEQRTLDAFHTSGWSITGATSVTALEPRAETSDAIDLTACVDTSTLEYRDSAGQRREPADAADLHELDVHMVRGDDDSWRVSRIDVVRAVTRPDDSPVPDASPTEGSPCTF